MALGTEDPKENFKTVALQMPFIFVEPKADEADPKKFKIRGLHPWSMEQVAGLPIVPLAGSGEQIVYPVSLGDVTTSIANAVNITDSQAIEVKGGKGMTQKELIDFYAKLRNKNILYVPTPTPILSFVLDHFPHGLLAGYAPRVMANLSEEESRSANEPFDELLGRPAQSMEEAHELLNVEGATVELAAPPIVDHLRAHAGKIMKIGLASLALVGAAYAAHSISTTQ